MLLLSKCIKLLEVNVLTKHAQSVIVFLKDLVKFNISFHILCPRHCESAVQRISLVYCLDQFQNDSI